MDDDQRLSAAVLREGSRLRDWLRRHLADPSDVEDVLQDAFFELVLAYRLAKPIENVGAWLLRVVRNRSTDLFRKKRAAPLADHAVQGEDGEALWLEDLLPSLAAGPDADLAQAVLWEALDDALAELPAEQREVFLGHEVEGLTFREMSALTGVGVNTLLSRKRYAVLQLRRRLQAVHDELRDE
jgi:RNA polymerase sigma factor (sigma-70 family)